MTTVILPRRNEKHLLEDVPAEAREGMTFHLVESVDQVLDLALEDPIPRGGRDPGIAASGEQLSRSPCPDRTKRVPGHRWPILRLRADRVLAILDVLCGVA